MKAKHSSGEVRTGGLGLVLAAGTISLVAGGALLPVALWNLFRYSPYQDPGDLGTGLWLGIASALLIGIPLLALAITAIRVLTRNYRAWKRTLTPGQRLAVTFAEALGLEAAHIAWRDHNRKEDARLTDSVMGDERKS